MSALGQKQTFAVQNVMSALPPKADMCGATRDVRFVPKVDIGLIYSITSSARPIIGVGMLSPSAFAVLRLMISSTSSARLLALENAASIDANLAEWFRRAAAVTQ